MKMKRQALLVSLYAVIHLLIIDMIYIFLFLKSVNPSVEIIIYNIIWVLISIAVSNNSYLESKDQRPW